MSQNCKNSQILYEWITIWDLTNCPDLSEHVHGSGQDFLVVSTHQKKCLWKSEKLVVLCRFARHGSIGIIMSHHFFGPHFAEVAKKHPTWAFAWAPKPFFSFGLGRAVDVACIPLVSESQSCPNLSGSMVPICPIPMAVVPMLQFWRASIWGKLQKIERSSMVFLPRTCSLPLPGEVPRDFCILRDLSAAWRRWINRKPIPESEVVDILWPIPRKRIETFPMFFLRLQSKLGDPSSRAPGMGGKLMDGPPSWKLPIYGWLAYWTWWFLFICSRFHRYIKFPAGNSRVMWIKPPISRKVVFRMGKKS